jgi:hypothetical protein
MLVNCCIELLLLAEEEEAATAAAAAAKCCEELLIKLLVLVSWCGDWRSMSIEFCWCALLLLAAVVDGLIDSTRSVSCLPVVVEGSGGGGGEEPLDLI